MSGWRNAATVLLALSPAVSVGLVVALQVGYPSPDEPGALLVWSGLSKGCGWVLLVASFVAAVLAGARGRVYAAVAAVGGLGAIAVGCLGGFLYAMAIAPLTVLPEYVDADGTRYRVTRYSLMQGMTIALTRVESENLLFTRLEGVGSAGFDSPRLYADVLLPRGYENEPETGVYPAPNGDLVVAVHGTAAVPQTYLVYDPRNGVVLSGEAVIDTSPFVLFGPEDVGDDAVFGVWLAGVHARCRAGERSSVDSGIPTDAQLAVDVDRVNPWVRDAARRVATAGGEAWFPQTLSRLR